MSAPLLATKLFALPPGKILVDRTRLINRLSDGLHPSCRLALIVAPAGFGKTTLLSAWAVSCGLPVSWLTLDEGDNDPLRFLAYIVAAADKIEANPDQNILQALQSSQHPTLAETLPGVLNILNAISGQFVLVLDDYHLITSPDVQKALTYLIEHQPPQMHLVIATRKDPPLPIPLLRARGQLVELRQADLRFTMQETADFLLQGSGVELSDEDIVSLASRTEGWAAGLQMAALSIRGREDASRIIANFSGRHEFIVDYFVSEVLSQQPEPIRAFLLQTSILKLLSGPLCETVTGQAHGQQTLERLQQANLFVIGLDDDRCWYRYHQLFRDLLVKLLWQEMPEAIPELNRRASDWYESSGMAEEAIDHALASKNFDRAADLIGKSIADCFWNRGETITISRWLEALPEERVLSQPELCAYYALALFLSGQLGKAEARLEAADKLLEPQASFEELSISGNRRLAEQKGMLAAVRAYFAYFKGDALTIIKFAHQALELLPEGNTFWHNSAAINLGDAYSMSGNLAAAQQAYSEAMKASRSVGNLFLGLLAGSKLAVALKNQGHLRSAEQLCRELIQLANTSEQPRAEITGKVYAIWGDILCEWNELERAESYLRKAVEMCQREGNVAALGLAYLYLLRVLWSRQDFSAMEETLLKIEKLAQGASIPVWINRSIIAWKTWVWIKQGRLEEAAQMLREFGVSLDHDPVFRAEGEYMSLARLLIAQGRLAEAGRLLDQLYADAEASGMLVWRIVFLAMHALAFEAQGMREEAIASLERALSFAEPEGYVQVFLEEGAPMASLIYKAAARGIAPQYAGRLLAAFSGRPPALDSRSAQNDELIEPLSQREIEVLRLLAEGLSNQEIAGRLYLSVRTVKFHTGNIYSKLGVKRRTEAVAKGRALGLVIL